MTHNILTAIAILVAASGGVFAQIRVQDNVAIGIANDTKAMTDQIMQDTAKILVNTTRTLEAITGDRSADANQFASAALGEGYSMAQAPDLASLAQSGANMFGGLSGSQKNEIATALNALNLVASLINLADGAKNPGVNQQYQKGLNQVTALTGVVEGMGQSAVDRTNRIKELQGQIGQAKDLKGALDQNTQWMNQNALVLNEDVGLTNFIVHQQNEQDKANLLLISQMARAMKTPKVKKPGTDANAIQNQLQALQDSARGN